MRPSAARKAANALAVPDKVRACALPPTATSSPPCAKALTAPVLLSVSVKVPLPARLTPARCNGEVMPPVMGHCCGKLASVGVPTSPMSSSATMAPTARKLVPAPPCASSCTLLALLTVSLPDVPR